MPLHSCLSRTRRLGAAAILAITFATRAIFAETYLSLPSAFAPDSNQSDSMGDAFSSSGNSSDSSDLTDILSGWKLATSTTDLKNFLFDKSGGNPVSGTSLIALCTNHDGLEKQACLVPNGDNLMEEKEGIPSESYFEPNQETKKTFSFRTEKKEGGKYLTVDKKTRMVKLGDGDDAAAFQIYTKDDSMILSFDGLYLCASFMDGNLGLSPFLVSRSLFQSWSVKDKDGQEIVDGLNKDILEDRAESDSSPTFAAYDLALVGVTGNDASSLKLPSGITGADLAIMFDDAIYMISRDPLLEKYEEEYETFSKSFASKVDIYSLVKDSDVAEAWESFIGYTDKTKSEMPDLQENIRAIVLANAIIQDIEQGTDIFDGADPAIALKAYFAASCNLAYMAGSDVSLSELVSRVEVPSSLENASTIMESRLPNGQSWVSPFINHNVKNLRASPTNVFPEIALLKHLDAKWLSDNTGIGVSLSMFVFNQASEAMEKDDIQSAVSYFADNDVQYMLGAAGSVCDSDTTFSFCEMIPAGDVASNALNFLNGTAKDDFIVDLRSVVKYDNLKEISRGYKDDLVAEVLKSISDASLNMSVMYENMTSDVTQTYVETQVESMKKTSKVARNAASAMYNQSKTAAEFSASVDFSYIDQVFNASQAYAEGAQDEVAVLKESVKSIIASAKTIQGINLGLDIFTGALDLASIAVSKSSRLTKAISTKPKPGESTGSSRQPTNGEKLTDKADTVNGLVTKAKDIIAGGMTMGQLNYLEAVMASTIPTIETLDKNITEYFDKMETLINATGKVMESEDESEIRGYNAKLRAAWDDMGRLALSSVITTLENNIDYVISTGCDLTERPTIQVCIEAKQQAKKVCQYMSQAVDAIKGGYLAALDIWGSKESLLDAMERQESLLKQVDEVDNTVDKIVENWDTDQDGRMKFAAQLEQQRAYQNAVYTYMSIATDVSRQKFFYLTCALLWYTTPERVPEPCQDVFEHRRLSDSQVEDLISTDIKWKGSNSVKTVTIPTAPEFPDDTGYIDLGRIMRGESTTFKLPLNATWLINHNWINYETQMTETVTYINKITLILPPKYTTMDEDVSITLTSQGVTDLGPAVDKPRYFQLLPITYETIYSSSKCSADNVHLSPYAACGAPINPICVEQDGDADISDGGTKATIFTEFNVTAVIKTPSSNAQVLAYDGLTSPLQLRANVSLQTYSLSGDPDSTSSSINDKAMFESAWTPSRLEKGSTCCDVGEYARDYASEDVECNPCPAGSDSQLGQLFCVSRSLSRLESKEAE